MIPPPTTNTILCFSARPCRSWLSFGKMLLDTSLSFQVELTDSLSSFLRLLLPPPFFFPLSFCSFSCVDRADLRKREKFWPAVVKVLSCRLPPSPKALLTEMGEPDLEAEHEKVCTSSFLSSFALFSSLFRWLALLCIISSAVFTFSLRIGGELLSIKSCGMCLRHLNVGDFLWSLPLSLLPLSVICLCYLLFFSHIETVSVSHHVVPIKGKLDAPLVKALNEMGTDVDLQGAWVHMFAGEELGEDDPLIRDLEKRAKVRIIVSFSHSSAHPLRNCLSS